MLRSLHQPSPVVANHTPMITVTTENVSQTPVRLWEIAVAEWTKSVDRHQTTQGERPLTGRLECTSCDTLTTANTDPFVWVHLCGILWALI